MVNSVWKPFVFPQSLGKVLCGYVTQPGDVNGKKELTAAYELGRSIQ